MPIYFLELYRQFVLLRGSDNMTERGYIPVQSSSCYIYYRLGRLFPETKQFYTPFCKGKFYQHFPYFPAHLPSLYGNTIIVVLSATFSFPLILAFL